MSIVATPCRYAFKKRKHGDTAEPPGSHLIHRRTPKKARAEALPGTPSDDLGDGAGPAAVPVPMDAMGDASTDVDDLGLGPPATAQPAPPGAH